MLTTININTSCFYMNISVIVSALNSAFLWIILKILKIILILKVYINYKKVFLYLKLIGSKGQLALKIGVFNISCNEMIIFLAVAIKPSLLILNSNSRSLFNPYTI